MKRKYWSVVNLLVSLLAVFMVLTCVSLHIGGRYINDRLMKSGETMATDLALLIRNNFTISDEEVEHMKSLSFNEMETDPVNYRLINIVNHASLHTPINNAYLVIPLNDAEIQFCPDQQTADFLGCSIDTPLNGMWLLNGKFDSDGDFEIAKREDIYRYTVLDDNMRQGMQRKEPFGTFSSDAWGDFITGYVPVYTEEGNFVGLLGIDVDPDPYQRQVQDMLLIIITLLAVTLVIFVVLFLIFFLKYKKAREGQMRYQFYSKMSHEMRTPLNGILGMAALSRKETNVEVLHHNLATVEASGQYLLELVNKMLEYYDNNTIKESASKQDLPENGKKENEKTYPVLQGKRILLCEDHPVNVEITRKLVERVGCTIEVAENGRVGLEKFEQAPEGYYDAVLMDIRMPEMDGIEATKRIRALPREEAVMIPILALTANSYREDIQRTREAGMDAHLSKPVNPETLYTALSDAMFLVSQRKRSEGKTNDKENSTDC